MSHKEQREFCKQVKKSYPSFFRGSTVIDVGSLDINGSNKRFFSSCYYVGIDVFKGKNVDLVGPAHEKIPEVVNEMKGRMWSKYRWFDFENGIDTMISTECLEHDKYWCKTILSMYEHLRKGGLMLITCASDGRPEHGTSKSAGWCSPGTNDYYKNISICMFSEVLKPGMFKTYFLNYDKRNQDLQFFAIK